MAIQATEVFLRAIEDEGNDPEFAASIEESQATVSHREEDLGTERSIDDLLHEIATRQLNSHPPQFVGFSLLATQTNSRRTLQAMIADTSLIIYHVPNPSDSEFPTAAVRVNPDSELVQSVLAPDLLEEVRTISYEAPRVD